MALLLLYLPLLFAVRAFCRSLDPVLTALLQRCIECNDSIHMGTQLVMRSQ